MISPHQKAMIIGVMSRALDEITASPTTTKCVDCKHYDHMGCCAKFGETIPEEVLETGCEEWNFNPNAPPF